MGGRGGKLNTGGMVQVTKNEWQGRNDNGSYAAVFKLPSNLSVLNKNDLTEIARGLGENPGNVGKRALINMIHEHGTDIFRVGRKSAGDFYSPQGWQEPSFTTNQQEALRQARKWLKSNK